MHPNQLSSIQTRKRPLNIGPFHSAIASLTSTRIAELDARIGHATIPQLQTLLQQRQLTSEELTLYYLWRIQQFDEGALNSVTELNPDALMMARQLDAARTAGQWCGPLHGTVVLLKDNIGTGDQMHTTAGARAMQMAQAGRDAFIVQKLRAAGVVILGKTAMTEWANWVSDMMPSGFSAVGGQVRSAYGSGYEVSGSSSGSAVAVAANFATFAIGTETWGSLTSPAVVNGVFTLKPTLGLVSRDLIIPITDAQDTAGPFTRHAIDLALVMNVIAGYDENDNNDEETRVAENVAFKFDEDLVRREMKHMRVGLLPPAPHEEVFHERVITALQAAGAVVVPLPAQPRLPESVATAFFEICYHGFKTGVNQYLADTDAALPTLEDILAFNRQDEADRIPYGQLYLENSARSTLTPEAYATAVKHIRDTAQAHIKGLLATDQVDLLAGMNTALGGVVNYPGAGYPAVVVPVGLQSSGQPIAAMLVGAALADHQLIYAADAIERHLQASAQSLPAPDLTRWQ